MRRLNAIQKLNMDVFISGPIPTAKGRNEKFRKSSVLTTFWDLSTTLAFFGRRYLFKSDGLTLTGFGAKLLASNVKYSLNQVPTGKIQQESKQLMFEPEGYLEQTETLMEHNVQMDDKETNLNHREWSSLSMQNRKDHYSRFISITKIGTRKGFSPTYIWRTSEHHFFSTRGIQTLK